MDPLKSIVLHLNLTNNVWINFLSSRIVRLRVETFLCSLCKEKFVPVPSSSLDHPNFMHLLKFEARGCLITPLWCSSIFWTYLCADGMHFNSIVCKVYNFVAGVLIRNLVFRGSKQFKTLAIYVDFAEIENLFQPQTSLNFASLMVVADACNRHF